MIILGANLIAILALALINVRFIISFEVAFIGAILVFYSSYKAVLKKMRNLSKNKNLAKNSANLGDCNANNSSDSNVGDSQANTQEKPENLSKKERFFIGFSISFGLLRLLSYAFLGISIIILINNDVFFVLPFLVGIAISSLACAIYVIKKREIIGNS